MKPSSSVFRASPPCAPCARMVFAGLVCLGLPGWAGSATPAAARAGNPAPQPSPAQAIQQSIDTAGQRGAPAAPRGSPYAPEPTEGPPASSYISVADPPAAVSATPPSDTPPVDDPSKLPPNNPSSPATPGSATVYSRVQPQPPRLPLPTEGLVAGKMMKLDAAAINDCHVLLRQEKGRRFDSFTLDRSGRFALTILPLFVRSPGILRDRIAFCFSAIAGDFRGLRPIDLIHADFPTGYGHYEAARGLIAAY